MIRPRFTPLLAALLLGCCGPLAAPKHALTLYDEPPKYPADFKHFDYVNPDAPKAASSARPTSAASTASTRSSARASRPLRWA